MKKIVETKAGTMANQDLAKIYDTVLSIPGMCDTVKIELKISRKNVFLLAKVIECGLMTKKDDMPDVLNTVNENMLEELNTISAELLKKAGLTDMNEKLNELKYG